MVLTRQGFNSKMVVNGDVTQIDLPNGRRSGLVDAVDVLKGVEGISFVQFDEKDVVRHTLVQRIVKAYERYNETVGRGPAASRLKLAEPRTGRRRSRAAGLSASHVLPEGSTVTFRRVRPKRARAALARFARKLQREVAKGRAFDCLITGDAELRRLNREFRGKDLRHGRAVVPLGQASSGLPRADQQVRPTRAISRFPWRGRAPRRGGTGTARRTRFGF